MAVTSASMASGRGWSGGRWGVRRVEALAPRNNGRRHNHNQ